MIFLFTDFGADGPYLGQMNAALRQEAPGIDVINLCSDAPAGDPLSGAYLLAALSEFLPEASVVLGVVDPGVGGQRQPVVLEADRRWFVGPDNGLFNTVARRAERASWLRIDWRPARLSASFHGRDLFAPIAARIARQDFGWDRAAYPGPALQAWPADLPRIIYLDRYGNAMSGWRYDARFDGKDAIAGGHRLPQARTFSAVPTGEAFWFRNSLDLIEIAVNRGSAREALGLEVGTAIGFPDASTT